MAIIYARCRKLENGKYQMQACKSGRFDTDDIEISSDQEGHQANGRLKVWAIARYHDVSPDDTVTLVGPEWTIDKMRTVPPSPSPPPPPPPTPTNIPSQPQSQQVPLPEKPHTWEVKTKCYRIKCSSCGAESIVTHDLWHSAFMKPCLCQKGKK